MSVTNPEEFVGSMMKIAAAPEDDDYGVDGCAVWPGADDKFPADWTESFSKEIVYVERGQIGLDGGKYTPVKVGETVAGALTGLMYFDSDPVITGVAIGMGEESEDAAGDHSFRFGLNFSGSVSGASGSVRRHMTVALDAHNANYILQSVKPSSVEFAIERDTGMVCTIDGTAYKCTRQTTSGSSAWTDRSTENDLIQTGNNCSLAFYVCEYAADKTVNADDKIRAQKITAKFDQANDANPDTGSDVGIAEPIFTPSGRTATITFTVDYGDTSDIYGRRDWTDAYNDGTAIMVMLEITGPSGHSFRIRLPRCLLDGPGKPVLDGPDVIAMEYTATAYTPEEALTNTFEGLDNHTGDIRIVNDREGLYMVESEA